MTGFSALTAFLPPWANPTIIGAIGIAVVAGGVTGFVTHKLDQVPYSRLEASKASLLAEYTAYKGQMAANSAKANADSLKEANRLHGLLNVSQTELLKSQKEANAKSKALSKILASAKPGDAVPIGALARSYYSSLRDEAPGPAANP